MIPLRSLVIVLLNCLFVLSSCSQSSTPSKSSPDIFVGSTPCDSLIRTFLNIPLKDSCDFIKWELSINKDSGIFHMKVNWGESKPNTNWFKKANKIEVNGTLTVSNEIKDNPNRKLYRLSADKFSTPVLLAEMNENVLHFLDNNQNLIVGNGGWGYVLNKLKSKT